VVALISSAPRPSLGDVLTKLDSFFLGGTPLQDPLPIPPPPHIVVTGTFPGFYIVPAGEHFLVRSAMVLNPDGPIATAGGAGNTVTFRLRRTRGADVQDFAAITVPHSTTVAAGAGITMSIDGNGNFLTAGDLVDVVVSTTGLATAEHYHFQVDGFRIVFAA
jgi:hypothetical protein